MSGEPIRLTAAPDTVPARALEVLARFPSDPPWVLVGGVAVFLRLGAVTRPTADADTVARSQQALIARITDAEPLTVVAGGELRIPVGDGSVDIDVLDLADDPLPPHHGKRMFALARRAALLSAERQRVVLTGADLDVSVPLATVPALTVLKTVSMVRRPHGRTPTKTGSDIHDLVRLTAAGGAVALGAAIAALDRELAAWVSGQIARAFGHDLRFTLVRLRSQDRSASAEALSDEDVAATQVVADAIDDALDSR